MYKLRSDVDISYFIQATVAQIRVGNSSLIVAFDKSVTLTILSSFSVEKVCAEMASCDESYAASAPLLFPLIGEIVCAAEATLDGGLMLHFEGGHVLNVFDDSDQFESFVISHGKQEIIV